MTRYQRSERLVNITAIARPSSEGHGVKSPQRAASVGLKGGRYTRHSVAERLKARIIAQPSGCLEVSGWAIPHSGHVQIKRKQEGLPPIRAHRLAWELERGPIPAGLVVCHSCDNPRCVNLDHLFLGKQRDNLYDSLAKGRKNAFGRQKLNAEQVREIRSLARAGMMHKDIAPRFGIKRHSVTTIVNRKSWAWLPDAITWVELPYRGEVA